MSEPEPEQVEETPQEPETPEEGDLPDEPLGEPEEPVEDPEAVTGAEDAPQAVSDLDLERVSKKVDGAAQRYATALRAHLGDDLGGWVSCPMCAGGWPGIVLPRMPEPQTVEAVKAFIGEPTHPDYRADTHSTPCKECDGYGVVATGSKVQGRGSVTCLGCNGLGYIAHHAARESGAVTVTNGAPMPPVYSQEGPKAPEPPEVERLKQLGYIVVEPVAPVT